MATLRSTHGWVPHPPNFAYFRNFYHSPGLGLTLPYHRILRWSWHLQHLKCKRQFILLKLDLMATLRSTHGWAWPPYRNQGHFAYFRHFNQVHLGGCLGFWPFSWVHPISQWSGADKTIGGPCGSLHGLFNDVIVMFEGAAEVSKPFVGKHPKQAKVVFPQLRFVLWFCGLWNDKVLTQSGDESEDSPQPQPPPSLSLSPSAPPTHPHPHPKNESTSQVNILTNQKSRFIK